MHGIGNPGSWVLGGWVDGVLLRRAGVRVAIVCTCKACAPPRLARGGVSVSVRCVCGMCVRRFAPWLVTICCGESCETGMCEQIGLMIVQL